MELELTFSVLAIEQLVLSFNLDRAKRTSLFRDTLPPLVSLAASRLGGGRSKGKEDQRTKAHLVSSSSSSSLRLSFSSIHRSSSISHLTYDDRE